MNKIYKTFKEWTDTFCYRTFDLKNKGELVSDTWDARQPEIDTYKTMIDNALMTFSETHKSDKHRCCSMAAILTNQDFDLYRPFCEQEETEIDKLKEENAKLRECVEELENAANSWMNDYDKLKEKYEPETLIESSNQHLDDKGEL